MLLLAMAATSNDAARMRLVTHWRRLHLLGMWTRWILYAGAYFPEAPASRFAAVGRLAAARVSAAISGSEVVGPTSRS